MLGLSRQGLGCDACGYYCHSTCASQAPPCPAPPDLLCTALGVHPETGTGTAYEGFLSVSWGQRGRDGCGWLWPGGPSHACLPQVPRPSGVRRGWQRVFAALSDSRLLLFDAPDPRPSPACGALLQALDLRWVLGNEWHETRDRWVGGEPPVAVRPLTCSMNPPGIPSSQPPLSWPPMLSTPSPRTYHASSG